MFASKFVFALLAVASFSSAAPILRKRQSVFPLRPYADFQISTGVAGDALARANAVFRTPLAGLDLASISDEDLDNINTMRGEASAFETTDFNPAIEAATGEAADALQRGKIANKVLKNLGSVVVAEIKAAKATAAGEDPSEFTAKAAEETVKLNNNAKTDAGDAGLALATPLVNGGAASSAPAAPAAAPAADAAADSAADSAAPATGGNAASGSVFPLRAYADFQISTGVAGDALARANAVFRTPLAGLDLASISDEDLDNINTMRGEASAFETTDFNPAIEAASGEAAAALQRGKIANKVLKNLGSVVVAEIKAAKATAAGEDASEFTATAAEETVKLNNNVKTDAGDAGLALATPLVNGGALKKRQSVFPLRPYAEFQISTGVAGDSLARANAVFRTPLAGLDLATISDEDLDNINTMRGEASAFETTDFNPAIEAASGEAAAALQRGKIANKVLKNLGSVVVAEIKAAKATAAGKDASAFTATAAEETVKLNNNVKTDAGDAGLALDTPL